MENINISSLISIIAIIAVFITIFIVIFLVKSFFRNIKRNINRTINRTIDKAVGGAFSSAGIGLSSRDLTELGKGMAEAENMIQKTVSGATNLYLPKIQKDFPYFHNDNAIIEIQNFINDYIYCEYENKEITATFFNKDIISNIQHKNGKISNIRHNKWSIFNYEKTDTYATITYQFSVGYDINSKHKETRYEIKYAYLLKQKENESSIICPNCGAPISNPNITICEYCGAKIVFDTILNWKINSIKEI